MMTASSIAVERDVGGAVDAAEWLRRQGRASGAACSSRRPRWARRRPSRRLRPLLQLAKLGCDAFVENVDFTTHRGLDRSLVLSLAKSHW